MLLPVAPKATTRHVGVAVPADDVICRRGIGAFQNRTGLGCGLGEKEEPFKRLQAEGGGVKPEGRRQMKKKRPKAGPL